MNFAVIGVGSFGLKRAQSIKNSLKGKLITIIDPNQENLTKAESALQVTSSTLEKVLQLQYFLPSPFRLKVHFLFV